MNSMSFVSKMINRIKSRQDKSGNRQIIQLTYIYVGLFLMLIIYVSIFVAKDSTEIINNTYNKREELFEERIIRGSILARNGDVLAYTSCLPDGSEQRVYPYDNAFAHVVGFNGKGKSGIENTYNFMMLKSNNHISERVNNDFNGIKNVGDSIVTTLDTSAQLAASNALDGVKGAVVAMNCETGEIVAMVSKPDFNPNEINEIWEKINSDNINSPLLNRSTQGLYPPGSTFKIVTAIEYIREYGINSNYSYDCKGSFSYEGSTINCYHGQKHGPIDFDKSFAKSCNSSFANITTKLNKEKFMETCQELLFGEKLPGPFNDEKNSYVPINKNSSTDELLQTGIGQGNTGITPYHMCLISSAIANDGMLMEPILVSEIKTSYGDIVKKYPQKEYKAIISEDEAGELKHLMREVVTEGTGTRINNTATYVAYGKTGSAEFSLDKSQSHAWFTGFAESDNEKIAIAVIIEAGGSGGEKAVPVARSVFDAYFGK